MANIVLLIGNTVRDPEVKYTQNQMAIANITLAINRYVKDGDNQTDFIRVTAFGKQAELIETYVRKENKVAIEGSIKTGSYEKDGKKVYTTDVIASKVEFLERKSSTAEPKSSTAEGNNFASGNDDLPF